MKTIGAAFSGGGFRAAGFTFGCLDMLHRAKLGERTLLENIAFSSSTSGGSLAMAFHAVRSYQGIPFPEILAELRTHIAGEDLLAEAIRTLKDDNVWREKYPAKTRNLINAFAIVYDEMLLDHARVGLFNNKSKKPPIERYCFNTTELNHASSFRFDLSGDPRYVEEVGNWYQHFGPTSHHVLDHVRLADVVAASSCFPGGFEPILFPHDFREAKVNDPLDSALVDDARQLLPTADQPFGLVDGGVVDNQGLYGLKVQAGRRAERHEKALAEQRIPTRDEQPFDLLISCDVSSFYVDPYEAPRAKRTWNRGLKFMSLVTLILLFLGCIVVAWLLALFFCEKVIVLLLTVPALAAAFAGIKLVLALRGSAGEQDSWKAMLSAYGLPTLKKLSIGTLCTMFRTRYASLSLILGDAFMTQIRRQQYGAILDGKDRPIPMISCMVYELASKNRKTLKRSLARRREKAEKAHHEKLWDAATAALVPSPAMVSVADSAASMGTTLWFDGANRQKLDHLIACGRFTMCYNLLIHLADEEAQQGQLHPAMQQLREQLITYWNHFHQDPTTTLSTFP